MSTLLNIGCGSRKLPGFINLDLDPAADLQVDVKKGLPFASDSVDHIVSEHFIEHLSQADGISFLRECRRVLKPCGVLRIATPDLDEVVAYYIKDWNQQAWIHDFKINWLQNACEMMNVSMRYWDHQWVYNEEELRRLATYAGLSFKRRWPVGESDVPELKGLEYRRGSLILEFVKQREPIADTDPLVSVLIPAYNPRYLDVCMKSAVSQSYPNIEIIVSDDNPADNVEKVVAKYAREDPRVKYTRNPKRMGAFYNYLRLFESARGDYIKFLNDDDLLHPSCIQRMVNCLQHWPYATLVTSHRQPIDRLGQFLPDSSATQRLVTEDSMMNGVTAIDSILSAQVNFIGEPTTALFRKQDMADIRPHIFSVGGRVVTWNVDVAMWLNLLSKGDLIYLAETLSYFRQHEEQEQRQPGAAAQGKVAWAQLRQDGSRMGFLSPHRSTGIRLRPLQEFAIERNKDESGHGAQAFQKRLTGSIIIPVRNNWQFTERCLRSLEETGCRQLAEVIVVDNGSSDATTTELSRRFPWVKAIRNEENRGFAVACNQGAAASVGRYLVFLNNDTEVRPRWLESLLEMAESDDSIGVVGSKLLYPDGLIQHAGVEIKYGAPFPLTPVHMRYRQPDDQPDQAIDVDAVTGASMLIKREVFNAARGFDEQYKTGYEDVDLCIEVKELGYRIVYEPRSIALHYEGKTPGRFDHEPENISLLHQRWMHLVKRIRSPLPTPTLGSRPKVSVVCVTYNSLRTIVPCVESTLRTLEQGDELIIMDNNSGDETADYLKVMAEIDSSSHLRLEILDENIGYAAAAARGSELAKNDFVIFLNPDTVVYEGWIDGLLKSMLQDESVAATGPVSNYAAGLQNVARYVNLDSAGIGAVEKIRKRLRGEWKGKTVETKLLIGFCLAMRKSALVKIGGVDPALFLGNDDLDLSWRLQSANLKQLVVPSVFVTHQGQVSFGSEPKPKTSYLVQQSTNQLYEKLYAAHSGSPPDGRVLWDIEWFTPQDGLLSIIIPVRRDAAVTKRCLEAIILHTHRPYEIIVVDNNSDRETQAAIDEVAKAAKNITVVRNTANHGYPYACNQGLAAARGEYLVVMNNDVLVTPHWASRLMAAFAVDAKIGAVGPRTNAAVGLQLVESADYGLDRLDEWAAGWHQRNAGSFRLVTRLIGFLVMLRRPLLERIGGFDPLFGVGNFEDDDYSLRTMLAGYRLAVADDVFVHHYGRTSFKQYPEEYKRLIDANGRLFAGKWGLRLGNGEYDAVELLRRGEARPTRLFIPLNFQDMFSPSTVPLGVGTDAPRRLLCIPDPSDSEREWVRLVESYLTTFAPGSETALVVRVEPADDGWIAQVVNSIQAVGERLGIDLNRREDLVIEARNLPSQERGRVYCAATAFAPSPGVRRESLIREAQACGLAILDGCRREDLLQMARDVVAKTG